MTFDDLKPFLNSAIRHSLTLLGGVLMAKGAITSTGATGVVEGLSGFLVGVVGLIWAQLHTGKLVQAGKVLDAIPPSAIDTITVVISQLAQALGAANRANDPATAAQLGGVLATLVGPRTAPALAAAPAQNPSHEPQSAAPSPVAQDPKATSSKATSAPSNEVAQAVSVATVNHSERPFLESLFSPDAADILMRQTNRPQNPVAAPAREVETVSPNKSEVSIFTPPYAPVHGAPA